MRQTIITIATTGSGLYEFTDRVATFVREAKVDAGLLTLFARHTSCSLLIQENADPDVRRDLESFFARLVPDGTTYAYRYEGRRFDCGSKEGFLTATVHYARKAGYAV